MASTERLHGPEDDVGAFAALSGGLEFISDLFLRFHLNRNPHGWAALTLYCRIVDLDRTAGARLGQVRCKSVSKGGRSTNSSSRQESFSW